MLQLRQQNEKSAQNSMNTQSNSMNVLYSMNIHDVYNFSSINHNEISKKKKFFRVETDAAHAKRKRHRKQF